MNTAVKPADRTDQQDDRRNADALLHEAASGRYTDLSHPPRGAGPSEAAGKITDPGSPDGSFVVCVCV